VEFFARLRFLIHFVYCSMVHSRHTKMESKSSISSETESTYDSDLSGGGAGGGQEKKRAFRWFKFVRNLYAMVLCDDNVEAVGFSEDGLCLEIRNPTLLSSSVLQKYFKHKNVSSFIRQLNNYGFKTIPVLLNSPVSHCFAHDCFKKNRLDLLEGVVRRGSSRASEVQLTGTLETLKEKEDETKKQIMHLKRENDHLAHQNQLLNEENKRLRLGWNALQDTLMRSAGKNGNDRKMMHQHQATVDYTIVPSDLAVGGNGGDMCSLPGGLWFSDDL
jgi:hypothetical protein